MKYSEKLEIVYKEISSATMNRMNQLVSSSDMNSLKRAAQNIKKDLLDDGFHPQEVKEFIMQIISKS